MVVRYAYMADWIKDLAMGVGRRAAEKQSLVYLQPVIRYCLDRHSLGVFRHSAYAVSTVSDFCSAAAATMAFSACDWK